jgi:gluconokinase
MLPNAPSWRILIVMGPSGSGKTTLARAFSRAFGGRFLDADDFHTPEAKAKMSRGEALTDDDREPWLRSLAQALAPNLARTEQRTVLACSALRERYRQALGTDDPAVRLVYLSVPGAELARRLAQRSGHFAGANLLESRFPSKDSTSMAPCQVQDWLPTFKLGSPNHSATLDLEPDAK